MSYRDVAQSRCSYGECQSREIIENRRRSFGDGRQCLPVIAALDGFLALVVRKLSSRPNLMPAAIARLRPSPVRSRIRSRSKSAMAARSVDNSRPCELDVSHNGSPSDRNAAPALPIRSISSSSSLRRPAEPIELGHDHDVPGLSVAISLASCGRSARTPLIFSRRSCRRRQP